MAYDPDEIPSYVVRSRNALPRKERFTEEERRSAAEAGTSAVLDVLSPLLEECDPTGRKRDLLWSDCFAAILEALQLNNAWKE